MRAELRRADERWEVLRAAEAWRAAGAIDADTAAAIRARHPDDRRRARPAFRALFLFLTLHAGLGVWGFAFLLADLSIGSLGDSGAHGALLALLALAAAAGAAVAIERFRLRGFGVEEGLAALAFGFALGACGELADAAGAGDRAILLLLAAAAVALALAIVVRWGLPLAGAVAAAALFLGRAQLPLARWLWIAAALVLASATRRILASERAAPAHRHAAGEAFAVSIVALYLAVHPAPALALPFDALGELPAGSSAWTGAGEIAGWAAMVALPALLLARGIRRRDRLELALGTLGALSTGAYALARLELEPVWIPLLLGGAAVGALVLAAHATFRRAPGRLRAGFTDAELYEGGAGRPWLEIAATLVALAPAPRPEEPRGFAGGGGEFGGGGASSKF